MTELQRRALARLPMSEAAVEAAYNRLYRPQDDPVPFLAGVRALCESHERLRAELVGLQVLHDEMRAEVRAVLSQMDDLAQQWGDEGVFRRCRDRLRKLVSGEGNTNE